MDLEILAFRNRVEDQRIRTARKATDEMVAHIGTKALPLNPLSRLRDVMCGYSLVKAAYPNKRIPELVHVESMSSVMVNLVGVQRAIMSYKFEL